MNIWEQHPGPLPPEIPDDRPPNALGGVYVVEGSHSRAGGRWDVETVIGSMWRSWQTMYDEHSVPRPVPYERPIALFAVEGDDGEILYDNIPDAKTPDEVEEADGE